MTSFLAILHMANAQMTSKLKTSKTDKLISEKKQVVCKEGI